MNIESIPRNKLLDTEPALTARLRELTLALDSDMSWFLDAAEDQEGFAIVAREDDVVVGWATVQWVRIERRYLDVFVDAVDGGALRVRHLEGREAVDGGRETMEVPRVGGRHHHVHQV